MRPCATQSISGYHLPNSAVGFLHITQPITINSRRPGRSRTGLSSTHRRTGASRRARPGDGRFSRGGTPAGSRCSRRWLFTATPTSAPTARTSSGAGRQPRRAPCERNRQQPGTRRRQRRGGSGLKATCLGLCGQQQHADPGHGPTDRPLLPYQTQTPHSRTDTCRHVGAAAGGHVQTRGCLSGRTRADTWVPQREDTCRHVGAPAGGHASRLAGHVPGVWRQVEGRVGRPAGQVLSPAVSRVGWARARPRPFLAASGGSRSPDPTSAWSCQPTPARDLGRVRTDCVEPPVRAPRQLPQLRRTSPQCGEQRRSIDGGAHEGRRRREAQCQRRAGATAGKTQPIRCPSLPQGSRCVERLMEVEPAARAGASFNSSGDRSDTNNATGE